MLEARHPQIQACYAKALGDDAKAHGTLTVSFVVERKTGTVKNVHIDPMKTEATDALITCVVGALQGLALQPADNNEGRGTFVYRLQPSA